MNSPSGALSTPQLDLRGVQSLPSAEPQPTSDASVASDGKLTDPKDLPDFDKHTRRLNMALEIGSLFALAGVHIGNPIEIPKAFALVAPAMIVTVVLETIACEHNHPFTRALGLSRYIGLYFLADRITSSNHGREYVAAGMVLAVIATAVDCGYSGREPSTWGKGWIFCRVAIGLIDTMHQFAIFALSISIRDSPGDFMGRWAFLPFCACLLNAAKMAIAISVKFKPHEVQRRVLDILQTHREEFLFPLIVLLAMTFAGSNMLKAFPVAMLAFYLGPPLTRKPIPRGASQGCQDDFILRDRWRQLGTGFTTTVRFVTSLLARAETAFEVSQQV